MKPIIEINNLSKKYRFGTSEPYYALRDVLSGAIKMPSTFLKQTFNKNFKKEEATKEEFWALKDISLKINPGETLGIIGRNGAGKSTLLKILSRITPPTTGEVIMRGRVASLLEVGTGFHPELTGRENIYLNGAILGMKRWEINNKFKEIVEFAEIEKFLDTPVKHYSSGMYMRLAFAVAAHLEPEILIIDEVLAVGDAEFQKKCLGKMNEVSKKDGRTILFVSHNITAIEQLCNRVMWLDKGHMIKEDRKTKQVIKEYLNQNKQNILESYWERKGEEFDSSFFSPTRFYLVNENKKRTFIIDRNSKTVVNIEGEVETTSPIFTIGYALYNEDNTLLYWTYQTDSSQNDWPRIKKGTNHITSVLPTSFLNEGEYHLELISSLNFQKWIHEPETNNPTIYFKIEGGLSKSPYWLNKRPGIIAPIIKWENNLV